MAKFYAIIGADKRSVAGHVTCLAGLFLLFFFIPLLATSQANYNAQGIFSRQHGPFSAGQTASSVDEGLSANLDLAPPVITYTPLSDICATGNRTLTATITDADGVPTSGAGLPVLYYKINISGSWNAVTGVSIGSNQYTFTFGASAVVGNIVFYYIVAQDNAATPNIGAQPSAGAGGFTANPPAAATEPTSPSFYVIQPTLTAGTYLVGAGQTYLTITDAVNAYNNSCLSGPVVFALTDAAGYSVNEVFPITIYNPSASATNTLTIKPNTGVNTSITGNNAEAIFKLYGADYITIDGSNNGTTSRNLTITNTGTSTFSSVIWVGSQSTTNGATNNTIRNCRLSGNSGITAGSITYSGIISCSGASIGFPSEASNANNTYRNNAIDKVLVGIHLMGPTGNDAGAVLDRNSIGSTLATNAIGYRGINANNQSNLTISGNKVFSINSSYGTGSDTDPTAGIILTGNISNAQVFADSIYTIRNTNGSGWQSFGICLQSTSLTAATRVYNNMIYAVTGNGKASDPFQNGHGIGVLSGAGYGIYYNSVNQYLNQNIAGVSSCLYVGSGVTAIGAIDLRNNVFAISQTTGSRYCVYSMAPNTAFSFIDYNCYFTNQRVGYLGANQANLAAWQLATGSDLNSTSANPIFIASNNLHLNLISPLNAIGTPIAGITTDYDGETRDVATPDIGADEIFPPACSGNTPGTITVNKTTLCYGGAVLLSATGFSYGLGISYQWESSPDGTTYTPISGETNPTSCTPPAISSTTYYRLRVACTFSGGTPAYSNVIMVTVQTPAVASSTPGSRCGPGTVNLAATPSAGTSINWYSTLNGGDPVATGNTYTTPSISVNTTYYAEAAFPGSNGTVGAISPSNPGGTISTQYTSWQVYFNVIQATKLLSVDVYPISASEVSTITIHRADNSIIASIPYVTAVSGGNTAQTIPINVNLDPGVGYYLYTANAENGLPPSGLTRNITGGAYPYTSTDIEITGNGFLNNNYYMCYYRWRFSNACATSPRTAVTASITSAASINITRSSDTVCLGSSTTLTASSSNTSFSYVWTPGNVSGSSLTVSPTGTTKYIVNGNDGSCSAKDSVTIIVVSAPSNVVSTPASNTKCNNGPAVALSASGGITQVNAFSENFNGANLAATGWTVSGGNASTNWQIRPNGYSSGGYSFKSNDSSSFAISTCVGASTAIKNIIMSSPAFSTATLTNATMKFWHHFSYFDAPDSATIEMSVNGTAWTYVRSWKTSVGFNTNFKLDSVVIPGTFLGKPTVYVRFRHTNTNNFFWAIDNLSINGNDQQMPITWSPAAGLYTDPGATIPYNGTDAVFTVYANPASTTDYIATASGLNGCVKKDTSTIALRPQLTATISGSTAICPLANATISISLTGSAPWTFTYTDGTTPVTVTGVNTSPYTFTVNPAVTTTYSITALNDAFCTASPAAYAGSAVITVNPSLFATWLGTSTNWNDVNNWCGGIPSSSNLKDVVIPGSLPFYPVITDNVPEVKNLQIDAGATVTIQASGTLTIKGDAVNNGTLNNLGTVTLNGTVAQSFPGGTGTVSNMNILEVNKASGSATLNRKLYITGVLKPAAGNITLTDTVTIASRASGTARIDKLGATSDFTYSGAGKFTVERYIPTGTSHGKGWQLLSAPTVGQTVKQAWQEGAATSGSNPKPGYGTTLTSDLAGATGLGFDFYTPAGGSSIKVYNPATNQFVGIASTNAWNIANTRGYMVFIRGDRSVNTAAQPAVPVTLRTTGKVYARGVDTPAWVPVLPVKLESVGNPYASAIDFIDLLSTSTGLDTKYYVWDPLLYGSWGYGGYQTISSTNGYVPTPGNTLNYPSGIPYTRIQSGQAFFVYSTPGGTVKFNESNKTAGSQQVFRHGLAARARQFLRAYLYTESGSLADGNAIAFDNYYSNAFDEDDAVKIGNVGEGFGIYSDGHWLAVEGRQPVLRRDTIHYRLANLRSGTSYTFRFAPESMQMTGLQAYLVDQHTQQTIPISLSDETELVFDVTADAGSRAPDRFYVIFDMMRPLPVTFIDVTALRKEDMVDVSWQVANEQNIRYYDIERSVNGRNFSVMGRVEASGLTGYGWTDTNPPGTDVFYRIRSTGSDGIVQYSKIVKLAGWQTLPDIVIYPNPSDGRQVSFLLRNQPAGEFTASLYDQSGKWLLNKTFSFAGGTGKARFEPGMVLSAGVYRLEILNPDNRKVTRSLVIR